MPAASPRLLVIDDEPAIRSALRRFFTRRGWSVDEADDGDSALARLLADADGDALPYDAVISDMRMQRLSGEELHDTLQRERPGLLARVIFSTGDVSAPDAARFVERTRCTVLEKPFELAHLAALAERLARGD